MATEFENLENKLCDYGCGQISRFQFRDGKVCCSEHYTKCPIEREKIKSYLKNVEIENPENKLCDYGCGQIAKYKFKNGKYCCSERYCGCPIEKEKNRKGQIGVKRSGYEEIKNLDKILCKFGCGQIAKFKTKNGSYCCSDHTNKCPSIKKKNKNIQEIENPDMKLCEFGCGQIARFKLANEKYCCSDTTNSCPVIRDKTRKSHIGKKVEKTSEFDNHENKLCDYGCGQIAKYQLKNGNICCSDRYNKCPNKIKENSEIQKIVSNEIVDEIDNPENILCEYGCGQIARYQFKNGKLCCSDKPGKCEANAANLTFDRCFKKYPELIIIENLKEGPNGKVLGRCKNSNCKRTRENDGYFELASWQILYRNSGINSISDGWYFYCCEECKKECILYKKSANQLQNIINPQGDLSKASPQELAIWRTEVFTRQLKDNPNHNSNFCEICHKTENLVGHHILPQKLYPESALDLDNGIVLCEKCHNKYGHRIGTECSTGNLANTNCK
jgi:hypothetical protein